MNEPGMRWFAERNGLSTEETEEFLTVVRTDFDRMPTELIDYTQSRTSHTVFGSAFVASWVIDWIKSKRT